MSKFDVDSGTLVFNFKNKKAAQYFKSWLGGQGEQDYWLWMECREQEEDGDITGKDFDYWNGNVINVECGRMDKNNE